MAVYRFGSADEADELELRREAEALNAGEESDIETGNTRIDSPIDGAFNSRSATTKETQFDEIDSEQRLEFDTHGGDAVHASRRTDKSGGHGGATMDLRRGSIVDDKSGKTELNNSSGAIEFIHSEELTNSGDNNCSRLRRETLIEGGGSVSARSHSEDLLAPDSIEARASALDEHLLGKNYLSTLFMNGGCGKYDNSVACYDPGIILNTMGLEMIGVTVSSGENSSMSVIDDCSGGFMEFLDEFDDDRARNIIDGSVKCLELYHDSINVRVVNQFGKSREGLVMKDFFWKFRNFVVTWNNKELTIMYARGDPMSDEYIMVEVSICEILFKYVVGGLVDRITKILESTRAECSTGSVMSGARGHMFVRFNLGISKIILRIKTIYLVSWVIEYFGERFVCTCEFGIHRLAIGSYGNTRNQNFQLTEENVLSLGLEFISEEYLVSLVCCKLFLRIFSVCNTNQLHVELWHAVWPRFEYDLEFNDSVEVLEVLELNEKVVNAFKGGGVLRHGCHNMHSSCSGVVCLNMGHNIAAVNQSAGLQAADKVPSWILILDTNRVASLVSQFPSLRTSSSLRRRREISIMKGKYISVSCYLRFRGAVNVCGLCQRYMAVIHSSIAGLQWLQVELDGHLVIYDLLFSQVKMTTAQRIVMKLYGSYRRSQASLIQGKSPRECYNLGKSDERHIVGDYVRVCLSCSTVTDGKDSGLRVFPCSKILNESLGLLMLNSSLCLSSGMIHETQDDEYTVLLVFVVVFHLKSTTRNPASFYLGTGTAENLLDSSAPKSSLNMQLQEFRLVMEYTVPGWEGEAVEKDDEAIENSCENEDQCNQSFAYYKKSGISEGFLSESLSSGGDQGYKSSTFELRESDISYEDLSKKPRNPAVPHCYSLEFTSKIVLVWINQLKNSYETNAASITEDGTNDATAWKESCIGLSTEIICQEKLVKGTVNFDSLPRSTEQLQIVPISKGWLKFEHFESELCRAEKFEQKKPTEVDGFHYCKSWDKMVTTFKGGTLLRRKLWPNFITFDSVKLEVKEEDLS